MTFRVAARRCAAGLAVCLAASGITGVADAATTSSAVRTSSAAEGPPAASGGMYGELGGGATRTVPRMAIEPTQQASASASSSSGGETEHYESSDGDTVCGVYANSAGMGSYCSSGTYDVPSLIERFPEMNFENCRFQDPPPGIDEPHNPHPDQKMWQLRTCLTNIDWNTWDGGDQRRIIMDLVLVDRDMDTTYHETELSDFLWATMQTTYPIPVMKVQPKSYPVVGQVAYFTFNWLDAKTRDPVNEGPYKDREKKGGPYVQHNNRGMHMVAEATEMTIDPQIRGVKPFDCTVRNLGYQEESSWRPSEQESDCFYTFKRSSSTADERSTAEHQLSGDDDVYRLKLDIEWDVSFSQAGGGMQPLGDGYHMIVYQALPVMDVNAVNEPLPDVDIG